MYRRELIIEVISKLWLSLIVHCLNLTHVGARAQVELSKSVLLKSATLSRKNEIIIKIL